MIDLECPNCGRTGSVPNDKSNTRLVCKKCHIVFHVSPTGRSIMGEPPPAGKEKDKDKVKTHAYGHAVSVADLKQADWAEGFFQGSLQRVKGMVAVLVVGLLGLGYMMFAGGTPDPLTLRAQQTADALVGGNESTVQGFSLSRTYDDTGKWYKLIASLLNDLKKASMDRKTQASVFIVEEDHASKRGAAMIMFTPESGAAPGKTTAKEAGHASADQAIKEVMTYWVLERGYWRIDGSKTAQAAIVSTHR